MENETIPAQLAGYTNNLKLDFDQEVTNRIVERLSKFDRKAGWPPKAGGNCSAENTSIREVSKPDPAIYHRVTKLALKSKEFQLAVGDRFMHYGTHLLDRNDHKLFQDEHDVMSKAHFHILFFSYSYNKVVEVFTTTNEILTVRDNIEIHLPEIAREIEIAIDMASCHKNLSGRVEGLKADAMLEPVYTQDHPSFGNRVYRVMFSEPYNVHKESPLLYTATVDMNRQVLIDADECNCGKNENPMKAVGITKNPTTSQVSQAEGDSTTSIKELKRNAKKS